MAEGSVSIMDSGPCQKTLGRKSDHVAISKGASTNPWNFYSTSYSRNHAIKDFIVNPKVPQPRTTGYSSNEYGFLPYTKELDEHDGATTNLDKTYETVTKGSYTRSDLVLKSGREALPNNVTVCAQSGFNKGITATLPIQAHVFHSNRETPQHSTTRSDFGAPETLVPTSSWAKDGSVGTKLTQKDLGPKTETGFSKRDVSSMSTPCTSFIHHQDKELFEFIGCEKSSKSPNSEDTTYNRAYPQPRILSGKEAIPHLSHDIVNGTKPTGFTRSVNKPVFIGENIKAANTTCAHQLPADRVTSMARTAPAEYLNLTKGTQSSMYKASFVNKTQEAVPGRRKIVNNQVQIGRKEPAGCVRNQEQPIDQNLRSTYVTENKEQFYNQNTNYRRGFNPNEKIELYHNAYTRSAAINKFKDGHSFRHEMANRHRAQREAFQTRNPGYYEEPHRHKQHLAI